MSQMGQELPVPAGATRDIEQVLLGLADGSYVLSTPDGTVAECGAGVVALLGAPADALAGRRGLRRIPVSQIRRGDIVFYDFRPDLRASHLAIARGRPHDGSLDTVEGNTSNAVRLERRGLQYVVLAARVVGAG